MKKIILTTLMALSFQSIAQAADLKMNKILEPSREDQEKRHYKELNDKMLKLKHNENAPLITEEQCFEQAYEELKRTPISPDTNNLNSPFKGYDNQIKGLTNFTNSQGRGMSCKDTTLLYIVDAVSAVKRINESNIEKEKKIENMIKASDRANQEADEKFRKIEEEKEFNSNPKNFPYKETWYDYENGIYELNLIEVEGKEKESLLKKIELPKECEYHGEKFQVPVHALKYNKEELMGLAVYMKEDETLREELRDLPIPMKKDQKKVKAIKINFGNGHLSDFNRIFYYNIYNYQTENPYSSFSINFLEYKNIKFGLRMEFSTQKYIERIDNFKFKIFPKTRFSKLTEYFDDYIFIYSSDCISMDERIQMEDRQYGNFIDNISNKE